MMGFQILQYCIDQMQSRKHNYHDKKIIINTTIVSLANIHAFICLNIPHNVSYIHAWTCDDHNINFGQNYHYEAVNSVH